MINFPDIWGAIMVSLLANMFTSNSYVQPPLLTLDDPYAIAPPSRTWLPHYVGFKPSNFLPHVWLTSGYWTSREAIFHPPSTFSHPHAFTRVFLKGLLGPMGSPKIIKLYLAVLVVAGK